MGFSFIEILTLIGALAFFMFGMKIMSEAIQKIAGTRIRTTLESLTSNRVRGILSGFAITSLIQSSSASTVLVVGFVNAGLLTLLESIAIIMGANVGTTITAWLIAIFGFSFNVSQLTLPLIAIGFTMTFSAKNTLKSWGEFLIGFALLFMGLNELKNAVPDLTQSPELLSFLAHYTDFGLLSILIFLVLGMLFTMLIQSSSAVMALVIILTNEGWLPFELAIAIVLGINIGTTITANLAALIGNVYAKRAALSHFLFNLIGVIWMVPLIHISLRLLNTFMQSSLGFSPLEGDHPESTPIALAIFHTGFNIVNTILLVWFIPQIAKLTEKILPGSGEEVFQLKHIGSNVIPTSEIQVVEAKKEMIVSTKILSKMSAILKDMISDPDSTTWEYRMNKIRKYEQITNRIEIEIANFLTRISEGNISERASIEISTFLRINSNLENIGDVYFKMSTLMQRAKESSIKFNDIQVENLMEIFSLTEEAHGIMEQNMMSENGSFDYNRAIQKEREIDAKRNEVRREHLKNIGSGKYSIQSGMFYNDLFTSSEEAGDYMFGISQAILDDRKKNKEL